MTTTWTRDDGQVASWWRWIIARRTAWASMPPRPAPGAKPWNRFGKVFEPMVEPLALRWLRAGCCGMIVVVRTGGRCCGTRLARMAERRIDHIMETISTLRVDTASRRSCQGGDAIMPGIPERSFWQDAWVPPTSPGGPAFEENQDA
jgi:hypothetical protein